MAGEAEQPTKRWNRQTGRHPTSVLIGRGERGGGETERQRENEIETKRDTRQRDGERDRERKKDRQERMRTRTDNVIKRGAGKEERKNTPGR